MSSCQYVTRYALFGAKTQRRQWECMPVSSRVVSSPVLLLCPRAAFPRRVLAPPNTPTTRAAAVGVNQATIDGLIIHRQRHREWPAGPGPRPDTNPALVVAAVCLSARTRLDSIALHASPPSLAFCFPRRPVGRSPGPAASQGSLPGPKAHRRATVWQWLPAPFGRSASPSAGQARTQPRIEARAPRPPAPCAVQQRRHRCARRPGKASSARHADGM